MPNEKIPKFPLDTFSRGRNPRFLPGYTQAKENLPGDVITKRVRPGYGQSELGEESPLEVLLKNIDENVGILTVLNILERGFQARPVTVTTSPIQVVDGLFLRGYTFLNPSQTAGLTSTGTMFTSAARTVGGSPYTSVEVGVSNYRAANFWLNVTVLAAGSLIDIQLETQDPITGSWAVAQDDIFGAAGITATGAYYANVGNVGVDVNMRLTADLTVADATFSVAYALKDGLPGSSSGLTRTIYLGGQDVNSTTGFPLLEGQVLTKFFRRNTTLYAVSDVAAGVTLNVFDLQ
jgi:hypothetical protein